MQWAAIMDASRRYGVTPYHIFQEDAQKTILTALSRAKAFTAIVFQGGTALRLFYGNPRFSDDLDFVLCNVLQGFDLASTTTDISRFLRESYPFLTNASCQPHKHNGLLQRCICVLEAPELPRKLHVHLELAAIPSYHHQPRILDFPPLSPAVEVETAEEILADKVIAFGLRPYLKGRDLWDVSFLVKERHLKIPWALVYQKVTDYGTSQDVYFVALQQRASLIASTGARILTEELSRFLSANLQEHYEPTYATMALDVANLLKEAPQPMRGAR